MIHTSRRTPAQWQSLVEQWQQSGQSATQFCKDNAIVYASFCKWRKQFVELRQSDHQAAAPEFIDLSALQSQSRQWHIVLSLGNGVELTLSQS